MRQIATKFAMSRQTDHMVASTGKCPAQRRAKSRANTLHAQALESLAPLGDNGGILAELAGFIIERRQ